MKQLLDTEDPRYTLTTLRALFHGATYGGVTAHGILRITLLDDIRDVHTGRVMTIGPCGVTVYTDEGMVKEGVQPASIIHAEVV